MGPVSMSRIIQALLVLLFITLKVSNFYISFQSPVVRVVYIYRAVGKRRSYYESLKRNNFLYVGLNILDRVGEMD